MYPARSAPLLSPTAFDAIVTMRDAERCGAALALIAPRLDDCQTRTALGVVPIVVAPAAHVELLAAVRPALQEQDARARLDAAYEALLARPLDLSLALALALRAIEPLLDAPRAAGARLRMGHIGQLAAACGGDLQAQLVLAVLLPRLAGPARAAAAHLLTTALSADIRSGTVDVGALARAVPALAAIGDLRIVAAYQERPAPLRLSVVFASFLPDPAAASGLVVEQLARAAANTSSAAWVGDAVAALAPLLPDAAVGAALRVAQSVRAVPARVRALAGLLPRLPESTRPEVLRAAALAAQRERGDERGEALAALVATGMV